MLITLMHNPCADGRTGRLIGWWIGSGVGGRVDNNAGLVVGLNDSIMRDFMDDGKTDKKTTRQYL